MIYKQHSLTNRPASSSACSAHLFMNNEKYFRITAYDKANNYTCILDSNGMFDKLWQFSSYLVNKGLNIIEASKMENVMDINIEPVEYDTEHIFLRATQDGKVELIDNTIQVADKKYMLSNG